MQQRASMSSRHDCDETAFDFDSLIHSSTDAYPRRKSDKVLSDVGTTLSRPHAAVTLDCESNHVYVHRCMSL